MSDFLKGIQYFFAGFGLIFKPGLKRYVIIPVIINVFVFVGLFFLCKHFFHEFNHWIQSFLPTWLQFVSIILWLLFFLSFFIIFIYTFITIGSIVAAPFNSFLAEKVEYYLTGVKLTSRSLSENIKDFPRIFMRQLTIIGFYLPRAILLLILFIVPVIQIIAALLWFLFNAWYLTFTYLDYPTDNHRVPLKMVRHWLNEKYWLSLGFGSSILVASMIPFVNFFVIPAAVAGAVKFWVQESKA